MSTTARTVAAPLLIAALLLGGGHTLPAAAGPATKTYTDSAHGISFRYPATWQAQLQAKNTGYPATIAKTLALFAAPDTSAEIFDMVGDKKLAGAALQAVGLKLFKYGNTMAGPIATGRATIGMHAFYTWSDNAKVGGGGTVLVKLYAGAGSAGTYYVETAILAHPAASAKILQGIIDSVTIR